jgi:hypothetical protein
MITDTATPLITKILKVAASDEISQTSIGSDGKVSKLKIEVVTPEQTLGPGGGRYSINITESAAKELAGRITNYFESGAR